MDLPKKKLKDGNEIPVLGFGTWQIEKEECTQAVKDALEIGYRHIDTAFAYYNESYIAPAIKSHPREKLFITTKLWRDFHDPKKVEEGCDISLKDLQTDYLDLLHIHWPEHKTMLDTLAEMVKLQEKGKVKSIGVCNATKHHISDIVEAGIPIVMNQVEFHPFLYQKELFDFCQSQNIAVTAYSPIAQGAVTKDLTIASIAKEHQKTPVQVTLRWLLQHDLVVIPKAAKKVHAKENFEIFDFELTDEEMDKIDSLNKNRRIINPDFQEFDY